MNADQGSEPVRRGQINRRSFLHLDYPGQVQYALRNVFKVPGT